MQSASPPLHVLPLSKLFDYCLRTYAVGERLGRSDLNVNALGMGCRAIGGPTHDLRYPETNSTGWGRVDDAESLRAIHWALNLGVNFFGTANAYGSGHSERVLGQAL